ncbi:MAG: hypothetical protein ACRC2V_14050, partial [Xenococcaceae cyanobacterium]
MGNKSLLLITYYLLPITYYLKLMFVAPKYKKRIVSLRLLFDNNLTQYKEDPIAFASKILSIPFLTEEQQEILISIRDNRTTNVQAAHSIGKSFICSIAVIWWVFAVEGTCFTTAPSLQQVKDILWKEVRSLYDRNKEVLGGTRGELFLKKSETA